ncbi:hypothetical protein RF11_08661 [Thelohanellus kitauei]|uniref:DAGKc domain-containing protein n=1 Tax=Thelohanellus kitauei TaxID=669202 RepID=A0A0C2J340_THEKT|nr:hypothetical protein RF11_08661 [Thelohanellus kitauei]
MFSWFKPCTTLTVRRRVPTRSTTLPYVDNVAFAVGVNFLQNCTGAGLYTSNDRCQKNTKFVLGITNEGAYELNLVDSIIIIRRLYQDSKDIEVWRNPDQVICDDKSHYLVSSTPAEREELYHCLMMIKHQELKTLNLHPLHKWVRIRKRNISEREICCVCEDFISSQQTKFVTCDKRVSMDNERVNSITSKMTSFSKEENSVETLESKISQERHIGDISDIIEIGDDSWPVFAIINIRGGNNKGIEFVRAFKYILNRIQRCELCNLIRFGLLKNIKFHLIIGGGDGTIWWIMNEIKTAGIPINVGQKKDRKIFEVDELLCAGGSG